MPLPDSTIRADALAAHAPPEAWKTRSAGQGAKGDRVYDWATAPLPQHPDHPSDLRRWLLIRRSRTDANDLAFYLCFGPVDTTDDELIRIAGSRWAIEECFQAAKNEVGLDHYQVRRYDAWYRHITLTMLAHDFLAVTAAHTPKTQTTGSSRSPSPKSAVCWHT